MKLKKGQEVFLRGKTLKEGDEISEADAKKVGLIKEKPKKAKDEPKATSGS